jgi:chorismate lyase/3-hydroxybenzoate synthase
LRNRLSSAEPTPQLATAPGRLQITLSSGQAAPSKEFNLLLSFEFGNQPTLHDHPATARLSLTTIGDSHRYENWWYRGKVDFQVVHNVRLAECDDYTVAIVSASCSNTEDFRNATFSAYSNLLSAVRATEHAKIVKIWNYIGGINSGENDCERYKQFSIGRADAFSGFGVDDNSVPTATAIGTTQNQELLIIALASRNAFRSVENPRQLSAFKYPRRYGPKSPKFCRAGLVSGESHNLYLISGTAAVVGHESVHPYNSKLQLAETIRNLNSLFRAASLCAGADQWAIDGAMILRAYLRDPNDREFVAKELKQKLNLDDTNVVYIQGSICRRELMIEIDGARAR